MIGSKEVEDTAGAGEGFAAVRRVMGGTAEGAFEVAVSIERASPRRRLVPFAPLRAISLRLRVGARRKPKDLPPTRHRKWLLHQGVADRSEPETRCTADYGTSSRSSALLPRLQPP